MLLFADSSAIARAYLEDEVDHLTYEELLLGDDMVVATTELAMVEVPRAFLVARRARRILDRTLASLFGELDRAIAAGSLIHVVPLDSGSTLRRASELVRERPLGTLDAIHLAVADREGRALAGHDGLLFVTADATQAAAARALGLETRP